MNFFQNFQKVPSDDFSVTPSVQNDEVTPTVPKMNSYSILPPQGLRFRPQIFEPGAQSFEGGEFSLHREFFRLFF